MSKERKPFDLYDSVALTAEISCDKCSNSSNIKYVDDAEEAIETFFDDGWRSTPNKTYCPKCAKKYLKP